ncbi:MAG: hypothetical protein CBC31_001055 [Verrucomicrobia bacterium TMED71]|nr:MAG: hypothetical protein CBC31_001055 [Verrucomicrobia bacterium TMED71]
MKANWKIARCPAESAERKYNRSRPNVITAFSDSSLTQAYKNFVSEKLPKTFLVITLLEIVPVLGLIAGVIYYRLRLVAPFLRYLTFGQSFPTKWLLRVVLLVIILQQVSFGGIVEVPLMALLNLLFYRSAFTKALRTANLI